MIEVLKSYGRTLVRAFLRTPIRGKTRLRAITDRWLTPASGIELCAVGPCIVPLSHEHTATRDMAYGAYENREIEAIKAIVKPGDIVADVGANVGYLAAHLAAMAGPAGKVYTFEPAPTALQCLRQTAASNRYGNIEVYASAVSDRSGMTTFFETESILSHGYGRIDVRPSAKFSRVKEITVPVTSLDEMFREVDRQRFSFVKIDVEGQERQVIHGMEQLLTSGRRPFIMTEVTINDTWIGELRDYSAFLAKYGYHMHEIGQAARAIQIGDLRANFHGNVMWVPSGAAFSVAA